MFLQSIAVTFEMGLEKTYIACHDFLKYLWDIDNCLGVCLKTKV